MTLLIAQHGNFAEAYKRLKHEESETYRDQRVSVDFVENLSKAEPVVVLVFTETPHDLVLAPGLRSIGRPVSSVTPKMLRSLCGELSVKRAIIRAPHVDLLGMGRRLNIPVLPSLADMFWHSGPRTWFWHKRLLHAFKSPYVPCVANHTLNASQSLVDVLGLPKERVVPWDRKPIPSFGPVKESPKNPRKPHFFYAGTWREEKGLGDLMAALVELRNVGLEPVLSAAGHGDKEVWRARADALGLPSESVRLLGPLPNVDVRAAMCAADAVVVPSRASYPEGLPNTIHEALASGTPLVLSNHPAFFDRLKDGSSAVFFEAGQPKALAGAIRRLLEEPGLYHQLSRNGEATENDLYFGVEWTRLVDLFLQDPENLTHWVQTHSLGAQSNIL